MSKNPQHFEAGSLPIVSTGTTKDGEKVQVVNLVDLYQSNPALFNQLFRTSQAIYVHAFPKDEREPTSAVRGYVDEMVGANPAEGEFAYLVPLTEKGQVLGMASMNHLPIENKDSFVTFGGYIAIAKDERNRGLGQILLSGLENSISNYKAKTGFSPKVLFGEVEKPDARKDDKMRNVIRPSFHHRLAGFGAATLIYNEGHAEVVPYQQPGIRQEGATRVGPSVPLLPAMTTLTLEGRLNKMPLAPESVIGSNGQVLVPPSTIPSLPAEDVKEILGTVLGSGYGSAPVYSKTQIARIQDGIERAIRSKDVVYLVPIADTLHLDFARVK